MIWTDLKYAARTLSRTPALSLTLLLTIALGIGSNTAVVGFVRGLVTRDLPIAGLDRIVSVFARDPQDGFSPISYDAYRSLRTEAGVFELLGAARVSRSSVTVDGRSAVMSIAAMTPELATLIELPAADGVVISHRIWQGEFGGGVDLHDHLISIDEAKRHIAGVAPGWLEGLYVGNDVDVWIPLDERSMQPRDRSRQTFWALGRLRPGISRAQAQASLNAVRTDDIVTVLAYTAMTPEVSRGLQRMGRLLSVAAGAVFFIACVNVATFLLSRASARSRETSVRIAIGASRARQSAPGGRDPVVGERRRARGTARAVDDSTHSLIFVRTGCWTTQVRAGPASHALRVTRLRRHHDRVRARAAVRNPAR